ncbi:MAG: GlsB/YeaQ/YmgE family stress response membrane protein [Chloroflexota bacterium]
MFNFIGWLILGAIAGWGASKVMGTAKQQGLVMDIVVGIVGAFVGGFVISLIPGLSAQATGLNIPSLIVAFVGAVIVLFIFKRVRN